MSEHGHCPKSGKSPTYHSWQSMRHRCERPSHRFWSRYGGRGIKVCERWQTFANFLADMGERPEGMTLDRIDNARGYEPGNCRWATASVQQCNRAAYGPRYEWKGESRTLREWAEKHGLRHGTVYQRIKSGWSFGEALTTPASLANHARHK